MTLTSGCVVEYYKIFNVICTNERRKHDYTVDSFEIN